MKDEPSEMIVTPLSTMEVGGVRWIPATYFSRTLRFYAEQLAATPDETLDRVSSREMLEAVMDFLRGNAESFDFSMIVSHPSDL